MIANVNEQNLAKGNVETDGTDILGVIDLWCKVGSKDVTLNNNELVISGDILATFIAKNSEGIINCFEKAFPYEHRASLQSENLMLNADIDVKVMGTSFSLTGDHSIEIRAEIQISGEVSEKFKLPVMTELKVDETKKKSPEDTAALIIYYAEPGESVWNIARKYNTSVDEMIALNNLTGDRLQAKTMLLIPSV